MRFFNTFILSNQTPRNILLQRSWQCAFKMKFHRTKLTFKPKTIISFVFSGEVAAGLFLQPFRKNKRIRTAFSPAQLVQLEKAFEGNHYIVGTERKQLASRLGLTETQVQQRFLKIDFVKNFRFLNSVKIYIDASLKREMPENPWYLYPQYIFLTNSSLQNCNWSKFSWLRTDIITMNSLVLPPP